MIASSLFIVLGALSAALAGPPDYAARAAILVQPALCGPTAKDPLVALRSEIAAIPASNFAPWLAAERKTGKSVPALNWVRAVAPGRLPVDFPARNGFKRCASELTTYSDVRAAKTLDPAEAREAIEDWSNCLDLHYADEKPSEFEALKKCLISR